MNKLRMGLLFFIMLSAGYATGADEVIGKVVLPWENIRSFSMAEQEDYVVFSATDATGREVLYEAHKQQDVWTQPMPIQPINTSYAAKGNMGGVFMAYEGYKLYFHADFVGGKGGKDIYFSERKNGQWTLPQRMPFNTENDEECFTIVPGETKCAFVRSVVLDEKKNLISKTIYIAEKMPDGTWGEPQQASSHINLHAQMSPCWATDMKTLFFAQNQEKTDDYGYRLMYTHNFYGDGWVIPQEVLPMEGKINGLYPRVIGDKMYFLHQTTSKKGYVGKVCVRKLEQTHMPKPVKRFTTKIVATDGRPLVSDICVYNPTTLKLLGKYVSDVQTGEANVYLRTDEDYWMEIRKEGYSYHAVHLNAAEQHATKFPSKLVLFDSVQLVLNVFDKEIFLPLKNLTIELKEQNSATVYHPQMLEPGVFAFALPIGRKYDVKVSAPYFTDELLTFETLGDLTFQYVEREILMQPQQRKMNIRVLDAETGKGIASQGVCENNDREEVLTFETDTNNTATVYLRYADEYTITIEANEQYVFFTENVQVDEDMKEEKIIALQPLKTGQKIRLNNILFETNSAALDAVSFDELDRVSDLLKKYPDMKIELHAHTDNVGTKGYNKRLSMLRSKAVLDYLVGNGVEKSRLQSIGWGMEMPIAPNDTEEGKALNRRVEFVIL